MNLKEIRNAILTSDLNLEQLGFLKETINVKMANVIQEEVRKGSTVSWEKDGTRYTGTVISVNLKSISVVQSGTSRKWRISPSFISIVNPQ